MKIPTLVQSIESIMVSDGNGAREAVHEVLQEFLAKYPSPGGYHVSIADRILLELAARGFQVVPIEEEKDLSWP